jgi:6-phosphogluconolactonase (cycloisomerase 2 family)
MYLHVFSLLMFCVSIMGTDYALGVTTFSRKPCAIGYTPNSILDLPHSDDGIRYAGDRPRLSTCSGAAWSLDGKYIFAIQMHTSEIQVWEFTENEEKCELTPVTSLKRLLQRPEGGCISKNNKYFIVPNVAVGTKIYYIDENDFLSKKAIAVLPGNSAHGAQFSPDGKYLAYTCLGPNARVNIYKIIEKKGEDPQFVHNQTYYTQFQPMRPKSIDFTKDGRYVVIGHCKQLNNFEGDAKGLISVHKFNRKEGTINPDPVSIVDEDVYSTETVAFSPDDSAIFAVDQVNDRVTGHEFNPRSGKIGKSWVALKNPKSKLSLPHGIGFSRDGRHVAVTSYGDDKLTIYKVLNDGEEDTEE